MGNEHLIKVVKAGMSEICSFFKSDFLKIVAFENCKKDHDAVFLHQNLLNKKHHRES